MTTAQSACSLPVMVGACSLVSWSQRHLFLTASCCKRLLLCLASSFVPSVKFPVTSMGVPYAKHVRSVRLRSYTRELKCWPGGFSADMFAV